MSYPLHVAVDAHDVLRDHRGIGVYLRAMLARFAQRDDVRLTLIVRELFARRHASAIAQVLGSERFAIASRVPRNADVSWHPWNGTFASPGRGPSVATIHDVVPFAFPSDDVRERKRRQAPFLRSARATRILTDSSFSKAEIERYLGVSAERIVVVPLAADPRFSPGDALALPEALRDRPYVLTVGANDERKNLVTLVAAHRRVFPDGEVALACVTTRAPEGTIELRDVRFGLLRDLYRGALAFAMPSIYEGFGIPPLEAMRCGTPVIASRAASLPEVCGDAALYVDEPRSVDAWAAALRRLADDGALQADLRRRGSERAAQFSWNATADATLAVLCEAAES
jgi:glycosyltransferase involved in cell wall biosynthesis